MDSIKTKKKWDAQKQNEYYKQYRIKNKEKLDAYHKQWEEQNPNYRAEYYQENKEKQLAQNKEWRERNPEKKKELWQEWYKENPERSPRRRFTEAKNKAVKKRGIEWVLTFEEYCSLIVLPCYYCNNELGQPVKRACGLDRLDSNIGYQLDNVVSCCYTCNCIKNEFLTPEETKIAVSAILNYRFLKEASKKS